jgi:hypothetical protein
MCVCHQSLRPEPVPIDPLRYAQACSDPKLDGQNRLPEIIQGIEFRDGIRQLQAAA